MASGKEHTSATLLLTPVVGFLAWHWSGGNYATTALAVSGCFSGIFISPDLDIPTRTVSETTLLRWSWGVGYLWIALWYPYAILFRHRGISHCLVVGTCTRLLYLLGWAFLGQEVLRQSMDVEGQLLLWLQAHLIPIGIFSAGLAVSDAGHWLMDHF
jgi:uncharacterized metal-binding protein